jgi:phosphohistidine swiveling domain-containing protein
VHSRIGLRGRVHRPPIERPTTRWFATRVVEPYRAPAGVSGVGIGAASYRGRACVVQDLMLAFDQVEPGDVLVAPFTGPSVNSLPPVVGALVVEEGGPLSHAAIVAREFGIAAVIGARDATRRIPHGAEVEVDPKQGLVRLL